MEVKVQSRDIEKALRNLKRRKLLKRSRPSGPGSRPHGSEARTPVRTTPASTETK